MRREKIYEDNFSAASLFIAGLLIIPSVIFNPSTEHRVLQFLFFCVLVVMSGKKTNFLLTIVIIIFIVSFNLIIPYGQVLYSIGPLKVTSGALTAGIHRAVTLQALVMLSKLSIRQDLKIPGIFGEILSESFIMFSILVSKKRILMGKKRKLKGKNIIERVDSLLLELSIQDFSGSASSQTKTTIPGYIVLAIVIALCWVPWFLS